MGVLILIIAIIALVSWAISRAVYVRQVKNNYKSPMVTASIIFLISFAILAGGLFLLFIAAFSWGRH